MKAKVISSMSAANPTETLLNDVIEALTSEGLSRESVLSELVEILSEARDEKDEMTIRAVGNAIDCLIGWSSPEFNLERIGASEYEAPLVVDTDETEDRPD